MQRAINAREDTVIGQEKEEIAIAYSSLVSDNIIKGTEINDRRFEYEINRNRGNEDVSVDSDNDDYIVYYENTKHTYLVEKDGRIISINNGDMEPTETIYVALKGDTLFFSNNIADLGTLSKEPYTITKGTTFETEENIPWKNERNQIKSVNFINKIIPTNTKNWFLKCTNLSTITNIVNLNTSKVTDMENMFQACTSLTDLDLSHFNTSQVTSMQGMFAGCRSLIILDLTAFNTSKVTSMKGMFSSWLDDGSEFGEGNSLTSLDLSSFNTSNVTNMEGMFIGCCNLTSLNVSSFDTSNVLFMDSMFARCSKLKTLDLSNFNIKNVTTLKWVFDICYELEGLNLKGFDTKDVVNMYYMFNNCWKLKTIYVSDKWDTQKVTNSQNIFASCASLIGGNGTKYTSNNINYARIDKPGQAGYFTDIRQTYEENNTKIEYIKFSGTQFINTGIVPSNHTIEIKFDYDTYYNNEHLFGTDSGWKYYSFTGYDNKYYWGLDGSGSSNGGTWSTGQHTLIYNKGSNYEVILDDETIGSGINMLSTTNLMLGYRMNEKANLSGKIYYVKITDKSTGNLVRDFIPVHNEINNSAGLYDKIERKFYRNNGTGTFIEGALINN